MTHDLVFDIAGVKYHDYPYWELKRGDKLTIVPDTTNKTDDKALAVTDTSGRQIGFVPKEYAHVLAPAVQAGFIDISGEIIWNVGQSITVRAYYHEAHRR